MEPLKSVKAGDMCRVKQIHIADSFFPYQHIFHEMKVRVVNVKEESRGFIKGEIELLEDIPGFKNKGWVVSFNEGVKLEKEY